MNKTRQNILSESGPHVEFFHFPDGLVYYTRAAWLSSTQAEHAHLLVPTYKLYHLHSPSPLNRGLRYISRSVACLACGCFLRSIRYGSGRRWKHQSSRAMPTPQLSRYVLVSFTFIVYSKAYVPPLYPLRFVLMTRVGTRREATHPHVRKPDVSGPTRVGVCAGFETCDRTEDDGVQF